MVRKPLSIFVKIVRAHLRKVSSTFSPVRALVSRNMRSEAQTNDDLELLHDDDCQTVILSESRCLQERDLAIRLQGNNWRREMDKATKERMQNKIIQSAVGMNETNALNVHC